MKEFDIEERVKIAVQNFESGYNCAQSVFLAYSDVFELNLEMAKKMSVSFGGGVGRMREVCGTVSAMAMLGRIQISGIGPTGSRSPNKELCNGSKNVRPVQGKAWYDHLPQPFACRRSQPDCSATFCKNG